MVKVLYTPVFRLEVDGIDRTRKIWEYLESLEYEDNDEDDSDSVSFIVANQPAFAVPARGAAVRLWLGWQENGLKYFGAFTVDEVSGSFKPATMSVTAKSANFTGGATEKEKQDREWENITLADLTAKIAETHGCTARVTVDLHYPHVAQTNESDISFLRRLAKEEGATLRIKDKTFVIAAAGTAIRGKASVDYSDVSSGSFTFSEKDSYSSAQAVYWDPEYARESSITSGSGKPVFKVKKRFNSAAEAQAAADNHAKRQAKSTLSMDLTLVGNPAMMSGVQVTCTGFAPKALNGIYLVKSCRHAVTRSGWTTQVTIEKTG